MSKFRFILAAGLCLGTAHAQTLLQEGSLTVDSKEFELAVEHIVPQQAQAMIRSKESNLRGFLLDYYTYKLMARDARNKGLAEKPDVLVQSDYLVNRLLTEALINDYVESQPLPDLEMLAKEKYSVDKAEYVRPEQIQAEHILVAVGPERSEDEAFALVSELLVKVRENPSDFSSLAIEYSDDPSVSSNKGNLGFFGRGTMVKAFEDVAFGLAIGEVSEPVHSDYGYHIIRVLDKRKEALLPFEDVKKQIIEEERKTFQAAKRDEFVAKYRDSPGTQINEQAIAELVEKLLSLDK